MPARRSLLCTFGMDGRGGTGSQGGGKESRCTATSAARGGGAATGHILDDTAPGGVPEQVRKATGTKLLAVRPR